jgi:hypothetical protein
MRILAAVVFLVGTVSYAATPAELSSDTDNGWPRTLTNNEQITVYQPDVESWTGNQIVQRAAVSITREGAAEPSYGVIWITARTEVDRPNRLVTLEDVKITRSSFPSEPESSAEFLKILRPNLPPLLKQISLDRLQAGLAITQAEHGAKHSHLSNKAPEVIYSDRPAILLLIDGKPVLRATEKPDVMRVINTRALVLFDRANGRYYFYLGDRWMRAPTATGPWAPDSEAPAVLDSIRTKLVEQKQVDLLNDPASPLMKDLAEGKVPEVRVSTRPAELIQTTGQPSLKPLEGTSLLYVENTSNDLFVDPLDRSYYALLSGRWFRAPHLNGPWAHVEAAHLPADFAKIPETHHKSTVLSSVPGTPEAQEAGIANSIPQTATVDRAEAKLSVTYDGPPRFKAITGTHLFFAENTAVPVIQVDPHSFYAVQDGVWFVANSSEGPWAVATEVPAVIYTIPPSSPLYYVTFVKVYGSTPQVVYDGYTPGYYGSYLDSSGVVVYGTGYYYGPWIGSYWIGYPWTFGFGFSIGFGGFYGSVCYPWWGPWYYPYAWGYPYVRYPAGPYVRYPAAPYSHPVPPTVWRGSSVYATNVYRAWPAPAVHNTWDRTLVANRFAPPSHVAGSNSVYGGSNGHVYRYGGQGWEEHGPSGWQALPSRAGTPAQAPSRELEQSRVARGVGEGRWQGFREAAPSRGPGQMGGTAPGMPGRSYFPAPSQPHMGGGAPAPSAPHMGGGMPAPSAPHMGGGFPSGGFSGGGHPGGGGGGHH